MPSYQLRNLCFTLNNYTDEELTHFKEWLTLNCSYAVIGKEVGEAGNPHLQGYAELTLRKSFNVVKAAMPGAHIESRHGTASQASDYCKKEDPTPWVFGEISKQGARNDIFDAYHAIRSGKRKREVAEDFTAVDAKFHRALDRYRSIVEEDEAPAYRPVEVIIYQGDPGVGKSRKAIEENPEAYRLTMPDGNDILRFDGYQQNKVLIIDDFDGWIGYRKLLHLLDVYKYRIRIMGGWTYAVWEKVIITTNVDLDMWYPKQKDKRALKRRIKSTVLFVEGLNC